MGSGLSVNKSQAATISLEAQTFLRKLRHVPFAHLIGSFLTSPTQIHQFRATFAEKQATVEKELIEKYNISVTAIDIDGVPILILEPPFIKPENESKVLLNIHGGAFCLGNSRDRTGLLMATEMGIHIYSIEYTLSPEVQYPTARDECLKVYRHLVKQFDARNILGMSSSSGGQLMCSMLLCAQKEGLPMLARQYLCTPALDLAGYGDSMVFNDARDVMPVSLLVGMVQQNYQGDSDSKDPLYSPLYSEYTKNFPPTIITVGTRDCMLSTGVRTYWKMRKGGVSVELLVSEGMWHGFNWEETVPEAVEVRAVVREFLSQP
ncbi:alpha/beta-hydrolase [Lepidopterella palustris CBS 459.81]|uniref:Alpha/beta-hydrolase n=1 Tax=Lepidopterella palustris CBS 459.81 TaxID=1314670 RepID=A0A8E2E759_9PEZI|nr:alpha/beta-hydrolase [Lepidopterella palustris CBS 459.81]